MALVSLHGLLLVAGATCLFMAAAQDVVARTIPHWAVAGIVATGVLLRFTDGGLAPSCLTAALIFAAASILWSAGWMGGGDAKLFGAVAIILPPASILSALSATAAAGAVLALPYLLLRGRLGRPVPGGRSLGVLVRSWRAERFRLHRGGPVPYGVAIAFGAVLNLWNIGA